MDEMAILVQIRNLLLDIKKLLEGEKSVEHRYPDEIVDAAEKVFVEKFARELKDSKPLPMTEEVLQDLTGVEPMVETDKAVLVVKNNYQKWIPKQYLVGDYMMGVTVDLKLSKGGAWVLKKTWDPYKEVER